MNAATAERGHAPTAHGMHGRLGRLLSAILTVVVASTLVVAQAAQPAAAVVPAAVSPTLTPFGFPSWYQDTTGTRLTQCIDVNDPFCTVLPGPGFDPTFPMAIPQNYPGEVFYQLVDATRIPTPGCGASRAGLLSVRFALESTFITGTPALNEQVTFGRIRITAPSGLCPNTTYTVTHPFGTTNVTTNASGVIAPNVGTTDVGCFPIVPALCDFSLATQSAVGRNFLRWDPAFAPAAPAGYLGDAVTPHRIIGGTYEPGGVGTGVANYVSLSQGSTEIGRTDLFTVMGKEAGPLAAQPTTVDFAGQNVNTGASAPRSVAITNLSTGPLTITAVAAATAPVFASQDPNLCVGRTLLRDQSCTVTVTFDPASIGAFSGSLRVTTNNAAASLTVPLLGTGTLPGSEPIISPGVASLNFGTVRIATLTANSLVRITNTGAVTPLQFSSIGIIDVLAGNPGDAGEFLITSNSCTGASIQPGRTCDINVAARPRRNGQSVAALQIVGNVSTGPKILSLTVTGTGGLAGVAPTIDAASGFPEWYQDELGTRIGECIDPNDPYCIVLPDATFTPTKPISGRPAFSNFPGELFYTVSDSEKVATPGCGGVAPGRANVRNAVEGAFINGIPIDSQQMTFGRSRVQATGLCPNSAYTFTHPYGSVTVSTDAGGRVKPAAGTQDVGCAPIVPATCDFRLAVTSPQLESVLKWDPAIAPAAPAGYLGDAVTLHRVTGAPYTFPGETTPANYFRIRGPVTPGGPVVTVVQTTLFSVMGKLNGPLVANPSNIAFAPTSSTNAQTLTLTNEGVASLTVTGMTLSGTAAADFTTDAGCGNAFRGGTIALAAGASCSVVITFTRSVAGGRTASVAITHTGANSPVRVVLDAVGLAPPAEPAFSLSTPALHFVDLHVGERSASQPVVISNRGGLAPLVVGAVTVSSGEFVITSNGCTTPVAIDGTCTITVAYAPTVGGAASATMSIPNNSTSTPIGSVALTGTGFTGVSEQAATIRTNDHFPDWFTDSNGVRVAPCVEPGDPNCIVLPDAGYDPARAMVFPTNYPSELFYQLTDSEPIPTDGCGGLTTPGNARFRGAVEGAFANGVPIDGDQFTFTRIRVAVTSGLCPFTSYTFTTPYGVVGPYFADALGRISPTGGTTDVIPATNGPVLTQGLLRWDPATAPAAPAGYLGDGKTLHRITGSRNVVTPGGEPTNYFAIDGTSLRTDLFLVSGRIAGASADPVDIDFGPLDALTTSPTQTITVTNVGAAALDNIATQITGPNANEFRIVSTSCTAISLAVGSQCSIGVAFTPANFFDVTFRDRSAVLGIPSANGTYTPVQLRGRALRVAAPLASLSATTILFANQAVNTPSAPRTVTISNGGTAPLLVSTVGVTGVDVAQYRVTNTCVGVAVAPGSTCRVDVVFAPIVTGTLSVQISITSNDALSPHLVDVSGVSFVPISAVTVNPTTITFPDQTINTVGAPTTVRVTSSGTAPLIVRGATAQGVAANQFPITNNGCGTAIAPVTLAPGTSCTFQIAFAPTTTGLKSSSISIVTNAASSPNLVPLSGTGVQPTSTLSATTIAFGTVNRGTTKSLSVTISNNGVGNLTVLGTTTTGSAAFRVSATTCTAPVAPRRSCSVTVSFSPTAVVAYTGSLVISTNAINSPQTVALTGSGR